MAQIDIENTKQQARELLDSRIDSVTELVKTRQRVIDLQADLAAAEKEAKRAYAHASKDGWTADELKKLGLENNAAGKRRSTTTRQKKSSGQDSPADSTPDQADPKTSEGAEEHDSQR